MAGKGIFGTRQASLFARWSTLLDNAIGRSRGGALRDRLNERGCEAVIPPSPIRKYPHSYDAQTYKQRNLIKHTFCRLKDFRRIATRYDRRNDTFLTAMLTWWLN